MEALLKKIEAYGFECEAGSLQNCEDWQRLRTSITELERQNAELRQKLLDPVTVHASMLAGHIARISIEQCAHTHGAEELAKYQQLAASADKTAATVQPNLSAPNGIPATPMHDAGAIAQCVYCRRYTLDQKALFDERYQPICDCGKKHGWSGSFTAPTPESKWHGAAPQPQAAQSKRRLSHQMLRMLESVALGMGTHGMLSGMGQHGGGYCTAVALRKRGLLDESNELTDAGRAALAQAGKEGT